MGRAALVDILSHEYLDFIHEFVERTSEILPHVRVLKVQEEVGEVAEAFIGLTLLKPKLGRHTTYLEVAEELSDVVITALVAIKALGFSPDHMLRWQMDKTRQKYLQ